LGRQQENWGDERPAQWLVLENMLDMYRQYGIHIIPRADILNKVEEDGIVQCEELGAFLLIQHDLGNVIYFSEKPLGDYVVLSPQFVIDAFNYIVSPRLICDDKQDTVQADLTRLETKGRIDAIKYFRFCDTGSAIDISKNIFVHPLI
jgi:hypothetical protein